MNPLIVKNEIFIHASPSIVWDALTNPEQTKKYMFGCETLSDWKQGSPLLWKMIQEGKEFIPVKGYIVNIIPDKKLVYTTFDPHSTIQDIPENYLLVTYDLLPKDDGTLLIVTQGDFNSVADGPKRYKEAFNNGDGWNPILIEIKKLLE